MYKCEQFVKCTNIPTFKTLSKIGSFSTFVGIRFAFFSQFSVTPIAGEEGAWSLNVLFAHPHHQSKRTDSLEKTGCPRMFRLKYSKVARMLNGFFTNKNPVYILVIEVVMKVVRQ